MHKTRVARSLFHGFLFLGLGCLCTSPVRGQEADATAIPRLRNELNQSLQAHDKERVKATSAELMKRLPDEVQAALACGEALYRVGLVEESLTAFDRVITLEPRQKPYLWQRGIALYDLGKFDLSREQFEVHRQVNGNDVENATWHYLCVAALENADRAREKMLPAPGDPRVPMEQVYELYSGRAKPEDVYAAADAVPSTSPLGRTARFYAALYVGLWHHAAGRKEEARSALQRSLESRAGGYMYDVARVRLDRM